MFHTEKVPVALGARSTRRLTVRSPGTSPHIARKARRRERINRYRVIVGTYHFDGSI
jgi:hypothetical protein